MGTLGGKVIVITGASAGIGKTLALLLGPLRVKLVLGARRVDKLEEVAQQARVAGSEAVVLGCDVARRADVEALAALAVEKFGRMDVMVANAGYGFLARVDDTTDEQFDDIVATNIKGTFYAMQAASRQMRKQTPDGRGKRGHIIAVSSAAGRRSLPNMGAYSMTKSAQLSLCEAMRLELKPVGIDVSTVHPISTSTEFFEVASVKSRVKIGGLGPIQSAETVCRKMIRLMRRPKPELWPHGLTRLGIVLAILMPRVADRILGRFMGKR